MCFEVVWIKQGRQFSQKRKKKNTKKKNNEKKKRRKFKKINGNYFELKINF
jgi:hypothetical protein